MIKHLKITMLKLMHILFDGTPKKNNHKLYNKNMHFVKIGKSEKL